MTGLAHLQRDYPDKRARQDWPTNSTIGRRSSSAAPTTCGISASSTMDGQVDTDGRLAAEMERTRQRRRLPGGPARGPRSSSTDTATKARLEELVWSHFDNMFGRNPVGRHFSFDAPREIEGVEFGWFKFLPGGIGRLAEARFVIDGSPKNGHYPYHPEKGDFGWTEGWIQFNTAFNVSLAYLAWNETEARTSPGRRRVGRPPHGTAQLRLRQSGIRHGHSSTSAQRRCGIRHRHR